MSVFEYIESKYEVDAQQQMLLRSLTEGAPTNAVIFKQWLAEVNFDALDYPSFRLVPALFQAFKHLKNENPYYGRMKGIYRYSLFKNSLLLAKAKELIKQFKEANIDFVLFKGMALTIHYYKNHSVRPMGDVDFLIHRKDIERAEEIFYANKLVYRYETERRQAFTEHSFDYIDQQGNGFDLHWYSLSESMIEDIDSDIWRRAKTVNWDGVEVKIMAPEDLIVTGCVNGVRELYSMRCDWVYWVYDVVNIIQAETEINWGIIYHEAKNRNLTDKVFHALALINSIAPLSVPMHRLTDLLANNPDFNAAYLHSLMSEGRTHGLRQDKQNEINETRLKHGKRKSFSFLRSDLDASVSKHIRYFLNENQQINLLYLYYKYMSVLKTIFDYTDAKAIGNLVRQYPKSGEGYVKIEPGLLALKTNCVLPKYRGSIKFRLDAKPLCMAKGEIKTIPLTIKISSSSLWVTPNLPQIRFGVTYHILSADRQMLAWDNPRVYFLRPRPNYVIFMDCHHLEIDLLLQAPKERGRYVIQLDLVHEYVTWFSQHGNKFPEFEILVN